MTDVISITKQDLINLDIEIQKAYKDSLIKVCKSINEIRSVKDIKISTTALYDAIHDIKMDITFIGSRRKSKNISKGKVAGVIVYRLSKANIIHTDDAELVKSRMFLKMNYLISVSVGFNFIKIDTESLDNNTLSEIVYSLARRHVNQETLGLVFDTMIRFSN